MADALGSVLGGSTVGRAVVDIVGDSTQLKKEFAEAQSTSAKTTSTMGKTWQQFGFIAQAAAVTAGAAFVKFGVDSVKAFQEAEAVAAQTQARLISTAASANVTGSDIATLSAHIQDYSGTSDEAIQTAGNMLLTFKNVRNEVGEGNQVFDRAVTSMADMAASGYDLRGVSIQLGKALNDPVKGATALSRAGVQFSESQKEAIATAVQNNDVLAAQKIILAEVETQFGGTAEAAGDTFGGQMRILTQDLNDFQEALGGNVVPGLTTTIGLVTRLGGAAEGSSGGWDNLVKSFSAGFAPLQGLVIASDALTVGQKEQKAVMDAAIGTLGSWTSQLTKNTLSTDEYRTRVRGLVDSLREQGIEESTLERILAGSESTIDSYAAGLLDVAGAHKEAAKDARAQLLAELALADGFLGIQGAALSAKSASQAYADAQAEVTKLARDGKKGTAEYKDAVLNLQQAELGTVESQLALAGAVASYIDEQKNGKATQREVASLVREYGRMAGLSKDDTNDLIQTVQGLIGTYKQVPGSKRTNVSAPGITETRVAMEQYLNALLRIPARIVTTVVVNAIGDVGSAVNPIDPRADGGIIAGARGFITNGPTMHRGNLLVGEGTRSTFRGKGTEAVIPFDNRGIDIMSQAFALALERLPKGDSRSDGGMNGPVTFVFELPWGEISKTLTGVQRKNRVVLGGR